MASRGGKSEEGLKQCAKVLAFLMGHKDASKCAGSMQFGTCIPLLSLHGQGVATRFVYVVCILALVVPSAGLIFARCLQLPSLSLSCGKNGDSWTTQK